LYTTVSFVSRSNIVSLQRKQANSLVLMSERRVNQIGNGYM